MDSLFHLFKIVTTSLIIIGLAYTLIYYVRKRLTYAKEKKNPSSTLIRAGGATHIRHNDKAGGFLALYQDTLIFEPNLVAKDTKSVNILLQKIVNARPYYTLKIIPTGLAITLQSGSVEKFWVYRHRLWSRLISEKILR